MDLSVIEDALLDKTREVTRGRVREVGTLPADFTLDMLKKVFLNPPGVYWIFGGGRGQPGRTTALIPGEWACVIVTRNVRGHEARRRGDATQVGISDLLKVLIPTFNNFTVPDQGTLTFVGIDNLYTGDFENQAISAYALSFQMPMAWPTEVDLAALDPFETFDAQHDIPTHETDAERRKWLAGDYSTSKPDAEDKVTLPQ